ncbi:MAG: tRNA lysidine(34) synthetase TilS [Dechloromonas sp.]|nr:tRNA lysidine(34) synthetase TilS [Dechloromonas sp.]
MAASRNSRQPELLQRVGDFLATHLTASTPVVLGLSGGCDSVTLLHLLHQLLPAGLLRACHIHHGLSAHADDWAAFCAQTCAQLRVPLNIHRVTVDRDSGLGLEAAARQARYAIFAREQGCLLLAQHADDQAETVLFNLLRGTGLTGAAGMLPARCQGPLRILRPLLNVSRAEIEVYARQQALRWVDDESNEDTRFSRNFLRRDILPQLSQRFPAAVASLTQAAAHFAEAGDLLDELAGADWGRLAVGDCVPIPALRTLSLARLKNLLRYRLRQLAWRVPVRRRLEEFCRQLQAAGTDRHPELQLLDGVMRVQAGALCWVVA